MSQNRRNPKDNPEEEGPGWLGTLVGVGAAAFLGYLAYKWITTTEYLFHYTTLEGARAIRSSRFIRKSSGGGDCRFGRGVYMTSLHPSEGPNKILSNNYGGQTRRRDNANCFFRFNKSDLPRATKQDESERDIWLCPHDIYLDQVDYVCGEIDADVVLKHDKVTGALTEVIFSK